MSGDLPSLSRVQTELALLEAMYPDNISYNTHSEELTFSSSGSSLLLRLPDGYPTTQHPEILSANNASKTDLRDRLKESTQALPIGDEALDAIVNAFQTLITETESDHPPIQPDTNVITTISPIVTIVIYLHHLLATGKRKLALAPPANVSGLSKPGYPGVLIYSGPGDLVTQHVNILKQENWAAFQVRYEEEVAWEFTHGEGMVEVETMGEVVRGVGRRKGEFLEAMRMKG